MELFSNCCGSIAWNDTIHEEQDTYIGICCECKEHCEFIEGEKS